MTAESGTPAPGDGEAALLRLRPKALLRHSSKFSLVNVGALALAIPASILVARELGPAVLGAVALVSLWSFYAGLVQTGAHAAAVREAADRLGRRDEAGARKVQNVGLTVELAGRIVPVAAIAGAALFQTDPLLRDGLLIATVVVVVNAARDLPGTFHWGHQRYDLQASINAVNKVVGPLFLLSTVWWLGPYSPLLAPLVTGLLGVLLYAAWAPSLGLRWDWDREETWRLVRIGLPLMALGLFYWGFREMGRTAAAAWLPLEAVGHLAFAATFVGLAFSLVADFGNVVQPSLWVALGRHGVTPAIAHALRTNLLAMVAAGCFLAGLGQAGFPWFVATFVPAFLPSVPVFEVLVLLIPLSAVFILPMFLMNSASLNRQGENALIWGLALVGGLGVCWVAVDLAEAGLQGLAGALVAVSGVLGAVLLWKVRTCFAADDATAMRRSYLTAAGLVGACAAVLVVLHVLGTPSSPSPLLGVALRILLVSAIWIPVLLRLLRDEPEAGPPTPQVAAQG